MLLKEFVDVYANKSVCQLSAGYVDQLRFAVSVFDSVFGRPAEIADLADQPFNAFVDFLAATRSADTARTRRGAILTLWRAAFDQQLTEVPPLRIRRLRSRRRLPEAWRPDEVEQLLQTALGDQWILRNGIHRGIWFGSLISFAWDTALRLGDCLATRFEDIPPAGGMVVTQHKTGDDVLVDLSESTRRLVADCRTDIPRRLVWPLWGRREAFFEAFRDLVRRSGIRPGTFKYIRRGSITAVEVAGGDGSRHAGHRSRSVTERHYIDPSQLAGQVKRPAALRTG